MNLSAHALGFWIMIMIVHGFLVEILGSIAVHLPLYLGVLIALFIIINKQWRGVDNSILMLFGLLITIMILSAIQGMNLSASLVQIMLYFKVFLLALLIGGCVRNEKDIQVVIAYCLIALVFGSLMAVYQKLTGQYSLSSEYVQRAGGLRGDPNDTAMLLVAGVPILISLFLDSDNKYLKWCYLGGGGLLLIGIVLTGSRGGFVALVIALFIMYIKKPTLISTFIIIVSLMMSIVLLPDTYMKRIETIFTGQEENGSQSMNSRKKLLTQGIYIFMSHPVAGVGPGNYGNAYMQSIQVEGAVSNNSSGLAISKEKTITAHNMYLEFFVENGFIAGLLLLFIIYKSYLGLYKLGARLKKETNLGVGVALGLLAMLIAGFFLSQGKNSVLWALIGLGIAAYNVKPSSHSKVEDNKCQKISNTSTRYPRLRR